MRTFPIRHRRLVAGISSVMYWAVGSSGKAKIVDMMGYKEGFPKDLLPRANDDPAFVSTATSILSEHIPRTSAVAISTQAARQKTVLGPVCAHNPCR
ncbi:hypothetical protein BS50DRAFT_248746 [Corynespora cassiicola Philippines]|uniref:Uncharacterized protein n=1 Tax=Corynespora cassiicola Philippines TaxID=1448308 RepID=A0A2T2P3X6_CORCC|nr:hypothetical protein BS50DRAFT_248746 [Corynespora cassiicola Philippines]